jgi:hypothetical protein
MHGTWPKKCQKIHRNSFFKKDPLSRVKPQFRESGYQVIFHIACHQRSKRTGMRFQAGISETIPWLGKELPILSIHG